MDNSDYPLEHLLVQRAAHDPAAFQLLYERYFKRVYAYVASKVNHHLDAEDLVADIFLQVVKGLPRLKNQHSFGPWLFTIARNLVTDFYRHQARDTDTSWDESDSLAVRLIEGVVLEHERSAQLRAMLNRLSERRREVIILRYFSGLTNQEIAQVLDLDERTVASHVSRGLKDLHECAKTLKME